MPDTPYPKVTSMVIKDCVVIPSPIGHNIKLDNKTINMQRPAHIYSGGGHLGALGVGLIRRRLPSIGDQVIIVDEYSAEYILQEAVKEAVKKAKERSERIASLGMILSIMLLPSILLAVAIIVYSRWLHQ